MPTPIEPGETARLLIIDDDEVLRGMVSEYLRTRGFEVETACDGNSGLQKMRDGSFELLILDIMMPVMDGFEVLRRMRGTNDTVASLPVIFLTAHGDEVDRIVGLELGADDYLSKPFNPRELLARVRAILRRSRGQVAQSKAATDNSALHLVIGDLDLDEDARTLLREGREIVLSAMEFDLLRVLMKAAGKVVTREALAREALGRRLLPLDRSLDMHITKLRRKLGPGAAGERIRTVRGIGYLLAPVE